MIDFRRGDIERARQGYNATILHFERQGDIVRACRAKLSLASEELHARTAGAAIFAAHAINQAADHNDPGLKATIQMVERDLKDYAPFHAP
jgi:hypothetical protein